MTSAFAQKYKTLGLSVEQEIEFRKLDLIYTEMRNRQLKAVQASKKMRSDDFFSNATGLKHDDRRCLAISSVIDENCKCEWTAAHRELMSRLRNEFGDIGLHYYQDSKQYSKSLATGQLHWTLMQVVGFADYDDEVGSSEANSIFLDEAYLDCIQDSLTVGGMHQEIQITFIGVILVATGLLMVGVPNIDVNDARNLVRQKLKERDLPLKEPFLNDIVHSTLFRVIGDKSDPELYLKLVALAKEFENVNLGTVTLQNFQVGPASWRMLSSEVTATPPVRQWTLGKKTPWEVYEEGISSGSKKTHSVSGITGFGLAKEIRETLETEIDDNSDSSPMPTEPLEGQQEKIVDNSSPLLPSLKHASILSDMFHPPGSPKVQGLEKSETNRASSSNASENHAVANHFMDLNNNHASTVSGAVGQGLVDELKKKIDDDERMLWSLYYTDFY